MSDVTTEDLRVMLQRRYSRGRYALFEEVHDTTGYGHRRSCDAIVVDLWPSGDWEVHGFELKTSRADWLHELRDPDKADTFKSFCDRWWLVAANQKVVTVEELPEGWGYLWARKDKLVVKRGAPKLEPQPIDRPFLAALLRRAKDNEANNTARKAAWEDGYARGVSVGKSDARLLKTRHKALQERLHEFQAASGIEIDRWRGRDLGEAVEAVLNLRRGYGVLKKLTRGAEQMATHAEQLAAHLEAITKAAREAGLLADE